MNWFERLKSGIQTVVRRGMPEHLYVKCERCHQMALRKHLESNAGICPNCGFHFRVHYKQFLDVILDADTFEEVASNVRSIDPLGFEDRIKYADRIKESGRRTGKQTSLPDRK